MMKLISKKMDVPFDYFTHALAAAWNTLEVSPIEKLLADDFHYSSFWVYDEMTSAAQYLEYLKGKFETLKSSGSVVKAEQIPGKDFIVLTQDNVRQCGIIIKVNDDGLIARADMMPLQFCNR